MPSQNELSTSQRQPVAMEIPHESVSPIHRMPNLNNFTDSQHVRYGQSQEDLYNNTTIQQDETIEGGFDFASSQPGPINVGGQVEDADR